MTAALQRACALMCFAALGLPAARGETRTPEHDPFARPARVATKAAARDAKADRPDEAPGAWKAELRAVMLAGPRSMVNVDGIVLRIGEDIDGYRLVEVLRSSAVFMKGGRRFELAMGTGAVPERPGRQP